MNLRVDVTYREKTLLGKILHASARDIAIDATLKLVSRFRPLSSPHTSHSRFEKQVAVTLNYLRPYYIRRVLECLTSASSSEIDEVSWTDRQRAYVFAGLAVVVTIGRTLVEQRHYHHVSPFLLLIPPHLCTLATKLSFLSIGKKDRNETEIGNHGGSF